MDPFCIQNNLTFLLGRCFNRSHSVCKGFGRSLGRVQPSEYLATSFTCFVLSERIDFDSGTLTLRHENYCRSVGLLPMLASQSHLSVIMFDLRLSLCSLLFVRSADDRLDGMDA